MSKTTQEKKEKKASEISDVQGSQKNLNKCCTCTHYPKHFRGCAQPCKLKKAYVARKCEACPSYKCKFN